MKGKTIMCGLLFFTGLFFLLFPLSWGSATESNSMTFTNEEMAYMNHKKVLRVLVLDNWQPYVYQDQENQAYQGVALDLLQVLSQASGLRIEWVPTSSYAASLQELAQGRADLAAVKAQIGSEEQWSSASNFVPYLSAPVALISHKDAWLYPQRSITIAMPQGLQLLEVEQYDTINTFVYPTMNKCLDAVRSRQADFVACDLFTTRVLMQQYATKDLTSKIVPKHNVTLGFGLPPGEHKTLASLLTKTIASYSTAEMSNSVMINGESRNKGDSFIDFVYTHPFELLCAVLSLSFVGFVAMFTYTRVRIRQNRELRGYEDSYRMLANTFGGAGMEYDYLQDRLTIFGEKHAMLDLPQVVENFREKLHHKLLRLSFTLEEFDQLLENNTPGHSYDAEFQCGMREGGWNWFRIIYIVVYTEESHYRPIRLIGCLMNIEKEHQEMEALMELGFTDQLTGLLNHTAGEKQIAAYLAEKQSPNRDMVLFLDVDYFKQFNDHFGHLCGDDVLRQLGLVLRETFTGNHILCRWGGDEFLLFLKEAGEEQAVVSEKIQHLRQRMQEYQYEGQTPGVSLSIGGVIAMPGMGLEALIRQADQALYTVKKKGRDGFMLQITPKETEGLGDEEHV